jgi:predicted AAA+ superfamily ATPase
MNDIRKRHIALINDISADFQRDYINQFPWNEQLIGIKGSRGVGKTTLLLQYIKKTYGLDSQALYISLDDLYFSENKLIDLADDFVARGGQHLFIDEVHKYPNWPIEIKKIYDYYPKLKVVFTGSSLLEILNSRADLSRRALIYNMQGLSFREYFQFYHKKQFASYTLNEILANHIEIALEINKNIKPLQYFEDYLKIGYFPFYQSNEVLYYKRLIEVVNMILEIELPLLRKVDISNISKIKKLLYIISQVVPFKPNISALAKKINITRNSLLEYLNGIDAANIINMIHRDSFGVSLLQKPEKIYLENTNLVYALSQGEPNLGNLRETFFLNQLSVSHMVSYPAKGDFLIDNKYLFEIGGKNKTQKQIAGEKNAFIVADNIEFGYENKIPLWLFGFLY